MWRKGKRKNEEHLFAGDGESKPPKKSFKKDDIDTDEIPVCDISKNRRVSVRTFQGKVVVDIREFYMKDGTQMPGKKDERIGMESRVIELGASCSLGGKFLKRIICLEAVNILFGISLGLDQWNILRDHLDEIDKAVAGNA